MNEIDRIFISGLFAIVIALIFVLMALLANIEDRLDGWQPVLANYKAQDQQILNPRGNLP